MSRRWIHYTYAESGGQRICFSPRWSRPVAPRRVSWILPAYARAVFLKKSFIIGLSLSLAFYPLAPVFVAVAETTPSEESAAAESGSPEPEEEPADEPAEEASEEPPVEEEESSEETSEEIMADEESTLEEDVVTEPEPTAVVLSAPEGEPEPEEASPCEEEQSSEADADTTLIESCNEAEVVGEADASSDTGDNAIVVDTVGTDVETTGAGEETSEPAPEAAVDESPAPETAVSETPATETAPIEPESIIDTGDADATAVLISDVNTTIVGTDVSAEVITVGDGDEGDIDLLDAFVGTEEENGTVAETNEAEIADGSGSGIAVVNGNEATVESTAGASAETGDNTIEGGGDAAIDTGDAGALAAVVNVVNTTLVGSNGLLAIVNIVGDYAGDIILPGEGLLSFGDGGSDSLETVENENEATIESTVTAIADTGDNTIEDSDSASVTTGDATAVATSETVANTNFVGDNWLVVVVNVFGEWLGGIVDGEDADGDGVVGYFFGGGEDGDDCETDCGDIVSVSGKNVAYVVNTVTASADTGGNGITGAGDSSISTGDATAVAAAFNFVNNNIIGSNWLLGIVNVFGSWGGDLVFAYPDLVTSVSDGRETALPGDTLEYQVTVENRGKADATDVAVSFRLPDHSEYRSASGGADHDGGVVTWTLSGMKKGENKSFSVTVSVDGGTEDEVDLLAYAGANTGTAEKHPEDNGSEDSTRIDIPDARITGFDADDDPYHTGLRVRRSKPEGAYRGGEAVTHWITVENTGKNPAYDVVAKDAFRSPDGTLIAELEWDLGGIDSGDGLRIEYTIVIPTQVGAGEYRYTARAEGRQYDDEEIRSKKAYAMLAIAGSAFASTFGAQTAEAAPPEDVPIPGEVRGVDAATIGEVARGREFPFWMLLLSGLAYALMINWSFFPRDNRRNI